MKILINLINNLLIHFIYFIYFYKEYIPGGRQIILRHPESATNQQLSNNQTVEGESILLQKFSQVNISETLPVSIIILYISILNI